MSRGAWVGIVFFVALSLPAWAVESASFKNRMWWLLMVMLIAFAGSLTKLITLAEGSPPAPKYLPGPYEKRYLRYVWIVFGVSFLMAESISIAMIYTDSALFNRLSIPLSGIGSYFFPVVARYGTELEGTISFKLLLQLQAIVTVFLLAGILSGFASAVYYAGLPNAERRVSLKRTGQQRPSRGMIVLAIPFAAFISLSGFIGAGEFGEQTSAKFCMIEAPCFVHEGDLALLAAAFLKVFAVIGFPIGAFLTFDAYRLLDE